MTLLERERELEAVAGALADAAAGRGRIVLIEADAGLGKTSLLRAAGDAAAAAGFACLRARAGELEREFAYGCARQLLEPAVARADDHGRLLGGAAAPARALFEPVPAPDRLPSDDRAFAVQHGVYWLVSNLADEQPLALLIDDLHWCDPESLRFLNYLAPRLEGLPVAVVGAGRGGGDEATGLARLAAHPEAVVLRPAPLGEAATGALCAARLGGPAAPAFARACRDATGGNPFFLEALLREAAERGMEAGAGQAALVPGIAPAAVAQAVLLRLAGAPEAGRLVRAAAVLGDGAALDEGRRLAGLSELEAARAADLLAGLAILAPSTRLEFAHPIAREAVLADLGSHARAEAHARAAVILAGAGAADERVAAQVLHAPPAGDPGRVELLRRAAAGALARGAPGAAVALLGRALAEPPPAPERGGVLRELGAAEYRLGAPDAVGHLEEAAGLIGEPVLLATTVRWLAIALTMTGDPDRAADAIAAAVGPVEAGDREQALLLEAELAAHAYEGSAGRRGPADRRLERFADLGGGTPGERQVRAALAFVRARASATEREAAAHIDGAFAMGRLWDRDVDVAGPFYLLLVGALATDSLDRAEAAVERALADAREVGSVPPIAFMMEFRGWLHLRRGAVAEAEADARTALDMLMARGIPLGSAYALALLIEALLEDGQVDEAARALAESGPGEEVRPGMADYDLLEARGLLRIAQGRTAEGVADLAEFGRRDELWGGASPLASRWRSRAAEALAAAGDDAGARRAAADDLERARRWGSATGMGVALRAAALVDGGDDVARLAQAADLLAHSPSRLERARALADLGAAQRRANRRAEARGALAEAHELARRCGAGALAARARAELEAAGGRSADPGGAGPARLTASERRVAALAAEGRSNPEIAQALFVTRKTVETHLGRIYRKLGIPGRGQLARALAPPPGP